MEKHLIVDVAADTVPYDSDVTVTYDAVDNASSEVADGTQIAISKKSKLACQPNYAYL